MISSPHTGWSCGSDLREIAGLNGARDEFASGSAQAFFGHLVKDRHASGKPHSIMEIPALLVLLPGVVVLYFGQGRPGWGASLGFPVARHPMGAVHGKRGRKWPHGPIVWKKTYQFPMGRVVIFTHVLLTKMQVWYTLWIFHDVYVWKLIVWFDCSCALWLQQVVALVKHALTWSLVPAEAWPISYTYIDTWQEQGAWHKCLLHQNSASPACWSKLQQWSQWRWSPSSAINRSSEFFVPLDWRLWSFDEFPAVDSWNACQTNGLVRVLMVILPTKSVSPRNVSRSKRRFQDLAAPLSFITRTQGALENAVANLLNNGVGLFNQVGWENLKHCCWF